MHKPYSESNSFAYGNLNSRLFLLQKGYCFLQLRQGLTAKMSEETTCLGECDWVQPYPAPTENTKPTDSSGLGVKMGSERYCCTARNSACEPSSDLGTHSSVLTEPSWFLIVWMPRNTRLLSYLEWGGESSHHIQNILSTFEWLATSKLFCKVRDAVPRL